jgi:hypothetical protein
LATAVAGSTALGVLARRRGWERQNNRVAICVDFDDAQAAAIRAGLPFSEMVERLAGNGATHLSLPEWTLNRLLTLGQVAPQAPANPRKDVPAVGHWNYLYGEADLVGQLAEALQERLPYTEAAVLQNTTLVFAGNLPTIGEIGLGFDRQTAALIQERGLGVVPQPVSYAWPEKALLECTLRQAGEIGRYVAFAGDMILGHEMHLDETMAALEETKLNFVYFAESRHQKGDWFIAKRRAPHVVLGHRLTAEEMIPLDYHAAAHNWAHLARERGIRFCYVNFFRVLHATAPLEGLDYVHHLKHALEDAGFVVSAEVDLPTPVAAPQTAELALAGLTVAGIGATAVSDLLKLPETLALPLQTAAMGGALALPYVEQKRNQLARTRQAPHHDHHHNLAHEHDHHHDHEHGDLQALYPPSYAPKLLALGLTTLTPVVGLTAVTRRGNEGWLSGLFYQSVAAGALAAVTSGQEYQLRIESYRGFNLDWFVPLLSVAWHIRQPTLRASTMAALAGLWLLARRQQVDVLALLDPGHAEGHTHHISAAMAAWGDLQMALGPKPARKWAGLGPLANALSVVLAGNGRVYESLLASGFGATGNAMGLVGFRHPERALQETAKQALPSFAIGAGVGGVLLLWQRLGN